MKRFALAGAVLALAVPATANAQKPGPSVKKLANAACKAQWKADGGKAAVREEHGSFGKCVTAWKQEVREAKTNAARECRAERNDPNFAASHGDETFAEFYGTNANNRNAFGKCVSSKAKAKVNEAVEAEVEATENAAQQCKAERRDENFAASHDGKTFREHYGTNKNQRNAFGKCVNSKKAEAEAEEQAAA